LGLGLGFGLGHCLVHRVRVDLPRRLVRVEQVEHIVLGAQRVLSRCGLRLRLRLRGRVGVRVRVRVGVRRTRRIRVRRRRGLQR